MSGSEIYLKVVTNKEKSCNGDNGKELSNIKKQAESTQTM